MDNDNKIVFVGQIGKVRTLADGSPRLDIDGPESLLPELGRLAVWKLRGNVKITIERLD